MHILRLTAAAALAAPAVHAQSDWPTRPLRIIVAFAPGSFTDVAARALGRELTEQLGQQVIVENRLGAGGTLGTHAAAKATPDGHTLLLFDNSFAIWPRLYSKLPFDPVRDFAPISLVAESPSMMVTRPGLAKTLRELVEIARALAGAHGIEMHVFDRGRPLADPARALAGAGMDLAKNILRSSNTYWRRNHVNGALLTDYSVDGGTVSVRLVDIAKRTANPQATATWQDNLRPNGAVSEVQATLRI